MAAVVWKVADAKNRFSEVLTLALTEGPQEVRRRDGDFVVMPKDEYERLKGEEPDFLEYLRSCPDLSGIDIQSGSPTASGYRMVRYLLDTCVISELSKQEPDSPVDAYLAKVDSRALHLSVVTIGELQKGCSLRPDGRRRSALEQWLNGLESTFVNRVLPFDQEAAYIWGDIVARTVRQGYNISVPDTMIAATALQHGMNIVTRNVEDFEPTGVLIVNPWESQS